MTNVIVSLSAPRPYVVGDNETTYHNRAVIQCRDKLDYNRKLDMLKMRFAIDNNVDIDNIAVTVISRNEVK